MELSDLGHKNLSRKRDVMSLAEYLDLCKTDKTAYATAAERMLAAIGEPQIVDTREDKRLSRVFHNRTLKIYPAFKDFYGMEKVVENIVSFLKHAAQGLEERKQIMYLLGPVGGGKSSLAERLKKLMEKLPFYALAVEKEVHGKTTHEISPVNDHPFGLFDSDTDAAHLEEAYGIPARYLGHVPSPWAVKRLEELGGDITKFKVVRVMPSQLKQMGVTQTVPGDENNQDISTLVGKIDLRMLERFAQDDTDAYGYSGTLCRSNQGMMEFVEMFKAPKKVLHPLLTATQEHTYKGTEGLGAIPFDGIVIAHSNESEWETFRTNKDNEAFLDRVCLIEVPYCLRATEETLIYKKLTANSALANAPCAPKTLEILSQYSVLSRLVEPKNSSIFSKMQVYDGQDLKNTDPKAKSHQEYEDASGPREGMNGLSTRKAYKIISKVFNFDANECAANPVHLFYVLEEGIRHDHGKEGGELSEAGQKLLAFLKDYLIPRYQDFIGKEVQAAYLESYSEYGQNLFDRYVLYADFWIQDQEFRDPDTGQTFDRKQLEDELQKLEKPAGISNPKDFRNEIVNFVLRAKAQNGGKNPEWKSYEKLRQVIEAGMFTDMEKILPVISFNAKASAEDQKKHEDFLSRMLAKGYTQKQVRLLVEWHVRSRKSS